MFQLQFMLNENILTPAPLDVVGPMRSRRPRRSRQNAGGNSDSAISEIRTVKLWENTGLMKWWINYEYKLSI